MMRFLYRRQAGRGVRAPLWVALLVSIGWITSPAPAAAFVYFVSPSGDDAAAGTLNEPWRTAAKAAQTAQAGDRVIFLQGVYHETLAPAHSGASDAQRITFMAMPGHEVVFDGSTGRLTGWTLESGEPGVDAVYSRPYTGQLFGLFQDDFHTAGRDVVLWDVGTFNLYDSNPQLDLRMPDPAQDRYPGTDLPKHNGLSQYRYADGVIRVRTRDARSPDEHDVRGAALRTGLRLTDRHYITIHGLKFRHFRNLVDITDSTHILIDQCDLRYAAWTGVWLNRAHSSQIRRSTIQGCGSWVGHYEDCINIRNSDFVTVEGNRISFGGHGGVVVRGGQQLWLRNNVFSDSGGHHLAMSGGASAALVEGNLFERAATALTASVHRVDHAAVQFNGGHRCDFHRNVIYGGGDGISITADPSSHTTMNRFHHNVIDRNAANGILLRAYPGVPWFQLTGNEFINNIVSNSGGTELWLDIPTGEVEGFFFNSFQTNILFGARPLRLWQRFPSLEEAGLAFPEVFWQNVSTDPLFTNAGLHQYTLRLDSPAIDSGTDVGAGFNGWGPDIGAFETP